MNDNKLRQLITEAVSLDRQIATDSDRLKEIKALLATEAESRPELATGTDGGGTSTTLEGLDGCVCRVTTAGRTLKSTIKAEGKDIEKVRAASGNVFAKLFAPVLAYKPVENFRDEASTLLGTAAGNKLVKLCENAGKISVSFETKEAT
jgi:hypothetical protein